MLLDQEIATYREKLPEFLEHEGKFVLIHHAEVLGIYNTFDEAMVAGYEKFLREAFLVRQISKQEKVIIFNPRVRLRPPPRS